MGGHFLVVEKLITRVYNTSDNIPIASLIVAANMLCFVKNTEKGKDMSL